MLTLALAAAAAAMVAGCGHKPAQRSPRVPVTVAAVELRDMPLEIETTGTVEPAQTVSIYSQVGGVLKRVAFHEGDEVRAGQVLFAIDPRPFREAAEQARAALARDRAQAENARLAAVRAAELVQQNYIAQQDYDQARAQATSTRSTVRADSAALANAMLNLSYATIRSPLTGRAGNLMLHAGNLVKASDIGNPLVTINQTHPILVRFALPQSQLPQVLRYRSRGLKVVARTQGGDAFSGPGASAEGRLSFINNAVDASTGTILLKAEFVNRDNTLWPGQFVSARLVLYVHANATVVPGDAITNGPGGAFVYVVNRDTTVSSRPVTVERTAGSLALVSSGLRVGELIVTDGQTRLSPGSKVLFKTAKPAKLAAMETRP